MRRLSLCLAAAAALVAVPAASADGGPMFVTQGGTGVAHGSLRYVAVSDPRTKSTDVIGIASGGGVGSRVLSLPGQWGLPSIATGADGLSHDGRTLVLAPVIVGFASPSRFAVVDLRRNRLVRTITLRGSFSFDALSPNASRMYLIQYRSAGDLSHYVVRSYDMRTNRLLPGKIADRSEHEKAMAGYPMTRTTSADGRWVYTLYQKPSGEPFVHALDTVGSAAYCIDLPANRGLYNVVLSLRDGGRTLAVHWRSGRPWLRVAVGSWRISYPGGGLPWAWTGAGIGGGIALLAVAGLLLRRRRSQELEQNPGQELGLA